MVHDALDPRLPTEVQMTPPSDQRLTDAAGQPLGPRASRLWARTRRNGWIASPRFSRPDADPDAGRCADLYRPSDQRCRPRGKFPAAIYLLGISLRDEAGFAKVTALFGQFVFKTVVVIVVWALAHHVLGGVRHPLTDFDIGSPLRLARRSAWFVNLAGIAVALLAAGVMW